MTEIEQIKGTIHMSDGREIKFAIDEQMWDRASSILQHYSKTPEELLEMMQRAFPIFQLEGPEQD